MAGACCESKNDRTKHKVKSYELFCRTVQHYLTIVKRSQWKRHCHALSHYPKIPNILHVCGISGFTKVLILYYSKQEAPDSYACLNQSTANRTKSTNICKCKKYIQTWCYFLGKRTAGAEIYLNSAIKGTSSFTTPNEIRKNHETKMCIGLPREVRQI